MSDNGATTKPRFELYTDGACSGNPGPGGWAYILRDVACDEEVEMADGAARTTNNQMELTAVIRGLEALPDASRVDVYSDSQYVVYGLQTWMDGWKKKGWKRGKNSPVKNLELWKRLDELRQVHEINAIWIRGHNEHPENERCDVLAVAAAEQYQ
ncbi:MAG: ribonuclease HI [Phycisphaerales bacterium]|nr:ribonuclease HI [Phycisphaerae bacterium]NNF44028.1 ribonuclease HI [Phycisphaerales bacterium]NNM27665.1 ribonuclease HI [Phycisphaerales bacterium]